MPRFLDTCVGTPRKVVINHGVELCDGATKQIARAVELCARNFRKVPVLLIAASNDELATLHRTAKATLSQLRAKTLRAWTVGR